MQLAARVNGRSPSPDLCTVLERESGGLLTCEQLAPDLRWHRVPDPEWTWHPGGRPVLDVARSEPKAQAVAAEVAP